MSLDLPDPTGPQPSGQSQPIQELHFYQQKAASFRVVHTDGAWCSVGPHGNLHLIFFSERLAIPQETFYPLKPDGELGPEIMEKRVGKKDYVREMEVDVVLNWKNVINLWDYLGKYIEANKAK
jgi:hypothetical protein